MTTTTSRHVERAYYFVATLLLLTTTRLAAADPIDLAPRIAPDDLVRVTIDLEAGGHIVVAAEPDAAAQPTTDPAPIKPPISVSAQLRYDERRIPAPADAAQKTAARAVRHYHTATATLKVEDGGGAPTLPDDRRIIVVDSAPSNSAPSDRATSDRAPTRPLLYSPRGPLSREQLDLIDVIGNSLHVDELLPARPVKEGDTWNHDAAAMGPLLALDSVAVCEVQSVLEEFNDNFAKVRFAGIVHGMIDSAATQQEVRGVYLFDRRLRRIARLNLAVRETRSLGGATPGLDAVAKLQMNIQPLADSPQLTDRVLAAAARPARPSVANIVFESPEMGFRLEHDRNWFITRQGRETVMLRRVDQGDLIAQCSIRALTPRSEGRQTSLEQFQKDITHSLGKNFGELVSSRQWTNAYGHTSYEVVARGKAEDMPVEWRYYLIAPSSGHRVSIAVTIEGAKVKRLAHTDRLLAESLQLFRPQPAPSAVSRQPSGASR